MNTLLYIMKIERIPSPEELDSLLPFVSPDRRERVRRYKQQSDKLLSLYSEIVLRYGLCREFGLERRDIRFRAAPSGKPELDGAGHVHFNISHTETAVAAAFSTQAVGVDIERIRAGSRGVAQRFFAEAERDYVLAKENELDSRFFYIWTRKEAWIKRRGDGLGKPLHSFNVLSPEIDQTLKSGRSGNYAFSLCGACGNVKTLELPESLLPEILERLK